jgi:hypothetical protein
MVCCLWLLRAKLFMVYGLLFVVAPRFEQGL